MPCLQIHTNVALPEAKQKQLLNSLSRAVAEIIGKPEQYVMATLAPAELLMSGAPGPAAFADVRSIGGLGGEVNRQLAARVCQLLRDHAGIAPERVFLNFTDVPAGDWGWKGGTLG